MSDATNPFIGVDQDAVLPLVPELSDAATTLIKRSDGSLIEVRVPEICSAEVFRKVVAAAFTAYLTGRKGRYPDLASVNTYYSGSLSLKKLAEIMSTSEFDDAMQMRGIFKTEIANGITPQQSYCIEILTDPSRRGTMETKLKQAGVTYTQYRSWLKNPLFANAFSSVTEDMIKEHQGDVHVALVKKATSGDMRAIEYFNQLSGRFNPDRGQILNLQGIINGLLEIITKNVKDPVVLDAVVLDIDKLIAKEGGEEFKALTSEPLDVEVVPDAFNFEFEER